MLHKVQLDMNQEVEPELQGKYEHKRGLLFAFVPNDGSHKPRIKPNLFWVVWHLAVQFQSDPFPSSKLVLIHYPKINASLPFMIWHLVVQFQSDQFIYASCPDIMKIPVPSHILAPNSKQYKPNPAFSGMAPYGTLS